MLAELKSLSLYGLQAQEVSIEVDIHRGMPSFTIVGLGDAAVMESKERVKSALKNASFEFPKHKISINLAPAHIKKYGARFDVPMALGLLIATGQISLDKKYDSSLFFGELSFTGEIRPIDGILPTAYEAYKKGYKSIYVPRQNALEASLIDGLDVYPIDDLKSLVEHITGIKSIDKQPAFILSEDIINTNYDIDFEHIKGQEHAKRALEIAAAGGHNVLMMGPPGSGKTMLAKAMSTILPHLHVSEALEILKIHSVAGLTNKDTISFQRPFRVVHHTASSISIVGGGNPPKPGEISLSHRGVLFLDEFAEFPQKTLEVLRQPLEDGNITISRASGSCIFPARMMLIAAMNPCPCGYYGDNEKKCSCNNYSISRYQSRISGPILDRIDMHLDVPRIPYEKLASIKKSDSSAVIRTRIEAARAMQQRRFEGTNMHTNSEMNTPQIKKYCVLDTQSEQLMRQAVQQMSLSGRAYSRILKLARTIADLANRTNIEVIDIAEAISYREKRSE